MEEFTQLDSSFLMRSSICFVALLEFFGLQRNSLFARCFKLLECRLDGLRRPGFHRPGYR